MSVRLAVRHRGEERTGLVKTEESWAAAARRLASGWLGDPMPIDLAGDPKVFVVDPLTVVAVRPMTRGDLPVMARWRTEPHVHRWWAEDGEPTLAAVTEKYAPRIEGETPTTMWVAEVNGRSVGFLQDYRLSDYPDYAVLCPDPQAVGVDYAIGELAWVGRGIGARVLWAWMLRARSRFPEVTSYFAAPDHRNEASLRMLDKAGFVRGTWFDEPRSDDGVDTVVGCTLDVATVLG